MAASTEAITTGGAGHGGDHARAGLDTALVGMLLFIASEVMFFGGLFAAYFNVRAAHTTWPPEGFELDLPLAGVLTAFLVTSSFTMQYAVSRIRHDDRRGMVRALTITVLLGVIFLIGQGYDYMQLGFGINSGIYGTLFFTMTGFHGAHVLGGVIGMSVILLRGMSGQFSARHHTAVEAVSMYWHFVDVVWVGLFSTLYLLR
jgi:cytochrome c oxidase subunit 3